MPPRTSRAHHDEGPWHPWWLHPLFLLPPPFFAALAAAIVVKYRDWRDGQQMPINDEERPLLIGEQSTTQGAIIQEDGHQDTVSLTTESPGRE
ncbi:hypothetical protein N431DRAFT_486436 [Stipitochalara longipes BDJ]|nr:hypothetical protein N431DRAFT_486436 [Stipitochalara longipes BDJ]